MSFVKTCLVVATFALLVGAGIRGASAQPDDEDDPTSAATEDDEGDRLPDADGDDDSEGEAAVAESTPVRVTVAWARFAPLITSRSRRWRSVWVASASSEPVPSTAVTTGTPIVAGTHTLPLPW